MLEESLARTVRFASGVLLDVGSFDKPFESLFSPYVKEFVALDLMEPIDSRRRVDVYGDARHLPVRAGSADTVLLTGVLHLVPDPGLVLDEINRTMRPGGHLICTTPFLWRRQSLRGGTQYCDYYRFSDMGLRYLAQLHGFEVVQVEQRGGMWAVVSEMIGSHLRSRLGPVKPIRFALQVSLGPVYMMALLLDRLDSDTGETLGHTAVMRKAA
ncbi:MAG: class I SAM-dependent methyltransferase [Actinomycetota bacterium]|nr:class I SAM-dependent methyltransferase [Actinomycetota bacterium]